MQESASTVGRSAESKDRGLLGHVYFLRPYHSLLIDCQFDAITWIYILDFDFRSSAEANKENLNEGKDLDTLLHHLYIAHELAVDESRNVWMQNQPEDIRYSGPVNSATVR